MKEKITSVFYRGDLEANLGERTRLNEIFKGLIYLGYSIDFYLIDISGKTGDDCPLFANSAIRASIVQTRGSIFADFVMQIGLLFKNRKSIDLQRVLLIGVFPMFVSFLIRLLKPTSRIFWSLHGVLEEMKHNKKQYYISKLFVIFGQFFVDRVLTVSEKMGKYSTKTLLINPRKIRVVPCAVAGAVYYDQGYAEKIRHELNFKDKFVIVYLGIYAAWQCAEETIEFFQDIQSSEKKLHLLVLTPDIATFTEILKAKQVSPEDYTIKTVLHDEVYQYLSACDLGILLRQNSIINLYASPTKFAEYLACGLPVITTQYVGDYSEIVAGDRELGLVVGFERNAERVQKTVDYIHFYKGAQQQIKTKCSEYALNTFKWEKYYQHLDFEV